jgi:integrase
MTTSTIDENARSLLQHGRARNTHIAYEGDWKRFCSICPGFGDEYQPATPESIVNYLAILHQEGKKPATIRRALAAIAYHHRSFDLNPCHHQQVKDMIRAVGRASDTRVERAKALRFDDLVRVIDSIDPHFLEGQRDRALLCVMWFCALRRSEARDLTLWDIELLDEGVTVHIRRSKTDQEGCGDAIGIPFAPSGTKTTFNPAQIIETWVRYLQHVLPVLSFESRLGKGVSPRTLPLFSRITTDLEASQMVRIGKVPFCERTISRILEKRLSKVLDITGYTSHSFRAGLITELACSGIEDHRIMQISRHRSYEVLNRYIREGQTWLTNPLTLFFEKKALQLEDNVVTFKNREVLS